MDPTNKSDSATDDTASDMEDSPKPPVNSTIDNTTQAPITETSPPECSEPESPLSTPGASTNNDGGRSPLGTDH